MSFKTVLLRDLMMNPETMEALSTKLSTYPLYTPKKEYDNIPKRSELNQRLLNHYKYREIGFETVGRFLDELEFTMCEIMPYYNELFKSVEVMNELPNPFDNVDVKETYKETRSGHDTTEDNATSSGSNSGSVSSSDTSTANTTGNTNSKNVNVDLPGDQISVAANNIDTLDHATNGAWNKSSNDDTTTTSGSSQSESESSNTQTSSATGSKTSEETVEHEFTKVGNQGVNTYAHDMIEFRQSIIDVPNLIINDKRIRELFMLVF